MITDLKKTYSILKSTNWGESNRKGTNLQDIPDSRMLIALQVKGHPFSQLFMNGPEAVGLGLEHVLHREEKKEAELQFIALFSCLKCFEQFLIFDLEQKA